MDDKPATPIPFILNRHVGLSSSLSLHPCAPLANGFFDARKSRKRECLTFVWRFQRRHAGNLRTCCYLLSRHPNQSLMCHNFAPRILFPWRASKDYSPIGVRAGTLCLHRVKGKQEFRPACRVTGPVKSGKLDFPPGGPDSGRGFQQTELSVRGDHAERECTQQLVIIAGARRPRRFVGSRHQGLLTLPLPLSPPSITQKVRCVSRRCPQRRVPCP